MLDIEDGTSGNKLRNQAKDQGCLVTVPKGRVYGAWTLFLEKYVTIAKAWCSVSMMENCSSKLLYTNEKILCKLDKSSTMGDAMKRRLPPLGNVRAFEVGARHLKLARAAEELNVTPSAVTHMIRRLEADLGVRLFQRVGREVALTKAGQKLLPNVKDAFSLLENGFSELYEDLYGGTLTVSVRPYFAMKWLSPRLGQLWSRLPNIELRLRNTNATLDFGAEDVDLDIDLREPVEDPAIESRRLIPGALTPVCSPALLKGQDALRRPEDLCKHTLLRDTLNDFWPAWLEGVGCQELVPEHNLYSDNTTMRIKAALDGQGIEIGCLSLISEELESGVLVAPFEFVLERFAFYVILPRHECIPKKVASFCEWLLEEAGEGSKS